MIELDDLENGRKKGNMRWTEEKLRLFNKRLNKRVEGQVRGLFRERVATEEGGRRDIILVFPPSEIRNECVSPIENDMILGERRMGGY